MKTNSSPAAVSGANAAAGFTSRRLFKTLLAAIPAAAVLFSASSASAAPNGTRPTILKDVKVVSVSATQMRVTGKLTNLTGRPIAGMAVDIYAVYEASFSRVFNAYTGNDGTFTATFAKSRSTTTFQVEVVGNGAYSRPLPTFTQP